MTDVGAPLDVARLSRDQAAVLTLFSGVVLGPIDDAKSLASKLVGRPVLTHELADPAIADTIRRLVGVTFLAICPNETDPAPSWTVVDDAAGEYRDPPAPDLSTVDRAET